ncbi:oxygenase MpaB family protein [Herbiconiux ginsengi]|uniref:ER-bound oxygenase mpaB/mpaB'/Rubber oxygenase catalytic domain-containing protein n=1 Tax=Herbiconiux ginsengi TaxID=381665 RepID=A0A1H3TEK5_9MICO|nr:oxygenase MpaB family protein [Herbiconiux ginsengi]SDZ48251.1 hypothetical protein SAMN05216554_4104 [Herbiconiux ginsengi]
MTRADQKAWLGSSDRYARLRRILALDPATDYHEITELFYYDFQSVMMPQAVSGFLFTFSAPRMSRILKASKQVEHHTAKRVVDTALLTGAVMQHGLEPGDGREAAKRVNAMHRQYDIHQDDFLAVGCEVPITSLRLAERFGWRTVTETEKAAVLLHYSKEARAFGSHRPLPGTLEEAESFWNSYLDTELAFEAQNKELTDALLRFVPTLFPAGLGSVLTPLMLAQVDQRILAACGLREPSGTKKRLSATMMRQLGKSDPKPDSVKSATDPIGDLQKKLYPNGFDIKGLGTHLSQHAKAQPSPSAQK